MCKFTLEGLKCPLPTKSSSGLCYWHEIKDKKKPPKIKLAELKKHIIIGAYLSKAVLPRAHLQGANLWKANLQGANLTEAHLQGAKLRKANLEGADLEKAHLEKANLRGAHLEEANLEKAYVQRADLTGAYLERANLDKAYVQRADLTGAYLQGASLRKARLEKANLEKAHLENTNLWKARLAGADLSGAYLQGADMVLTIFDMDSRLDRSRLKDVNLYLSYIDLAKSFRDASLFEQEDLNEKEINEKIADCIIDGFPRYLRKSDLVFDVKNIDQFIAKTGDLFSKDLFKKLRDEQKVKRVIYFKDTDSKYIYSEYIFYSDIRYFIKEKGNDEDQKKIDNLLLRKEHEYSFFFYNPISKKFSGHVNVSSKNEFLFNRRSKFTLYGASNEVYRKLYHFYSDEGMYFRTKHAHYRRPEVARKLLKVRYKWNTISGVQDRTKSWSFYWFKVLTGYGESILKPILISIFWIVAFGLMF